LASQAELDNREREDYPFLYAGREDLVDGELKSLLTLLINKVQVIGQEVAEIKSVLPSLATKEGIARLEREQELTRKTLGANHFTLTGRVDQLTRQYETLVGVRAPAAE